MTIKSGDWETHPYRVEVTPWLQIPHLERILLARGAYIAGLGVLETGLTELAIRLSRHQEYHELRERFPKRRDDRLKFLRHASAIEGPLSDKANLVKCFVRRLEEYSPLRDVIAHGAQTALSGSSDLEVQAKFKDFFAAPGGAQMRLEPIQLIELERTAAKVCRTARVWSQFYPSLDDRIESLAHG